MTRSNLVSEKLIYMATRSWKYIFAFLLLVLSALVLAIYEFPDKDLHIIACNVGQGDAILITHGFTQILTDGGPDKSVLTCLGKHMPFYDRRIELVISTHPDADHSTGLVGVMQNYKVDKLLINPINPGTQVYQALISEVGGGGIEVVNPTAGMRVGVGLIYLDILSPSNETLSKLKVKDVASDLSKYDVAKETNLYSVVYKLSFKYFTAILLGDAPQEVSDHLANTWGMGYVNYIKIPHHGSINGLTENYLKVLMPKVAVISVGKNSWGHPRPEILEMLERYNVKVLRTDQIGDIAVVSDGEKYWLSTKIADRID